MNRTQRSTDEALGLHNKIAVLAKLEFNDLEAVKKHLLSYGEVEYLREIEGFHLISLKSNSHGYYTIYEALSGKFPDEVFATAFPFYPDPETGSYQCLSFATHGENEDALNIFNNIFRLINDHKQS